MHNYRFIFCLSSTGSIMDFCTNLSHQRVRQTRQEYSMKGVHFVFEGNNSATHKPHMLAPGISLSSIVHKPMKLQNVQGLIRDDPCVCLQSVEVSGLNYKMDGLNKFTEYTVRVLAFNRYGPGAASEATSVTTHSDGEHRHTHTHKSWGAHLLKHRLEMLCW